MRWVAVLTNAALPTPVPTSTQSTSPHLTDLTALHQPHLTHHPAGKSATA